MIRTAESPRSEVKVTKKMFLNYYTTSDVHIHIHVHVHVHVVLIHVSVQVLTINYEHSVMSWLYTSCEHGMTS